MSGGSDRTAEAPPDDSATHGAKDRDPRIGDILRAQDKIFAGMQDGIAIKGTGRLLWLQQQLSLEPALEVGSWDPGGAGESSKASRKGPAVKVTTAFGPLAYQRRAAKRCSPQYPGQRQQQRLLRLSPATDGPAR